MTQKQSITRGLLAALIVLSIGGFLIHFVVHPYSKNSAFFLPLISGFLSIIAVPALFSFRKTVQYGYVLNGMLVIIGTITMIHFSIAHPPDPVTVLNLLTRTTCIDILLLSAKFFIGKAIFDLETFGADPKTERKGIWYRYPNYGWWLAHLLTISIVYRFGILFWRSI